MESSTKTNTRQEIFSNNLKFIMEDLGINQSAIIAATGASSGNISGWVNKKAVPSYVNQGRLAKFLCVPPEFLTTNHGAQLHNTLANRLNFKIKDLNLNKGDVYGAMGVTYYIFNTWIKGKKEPDFKELSDLAELLETTPQWLRNGYADVSAYILTNDTDSDDKNNEVAEHQEFEPTLELASDDELSATEVVDDVQYSGSLVATANPDDEAEDVWAASSAKLIQSLPQARELVAMVREEQSSDEPTDSDDDSDDNSTIKKADKAKKAKKAKADKKADKKAVKRKKAKRKKAKRKEAKRIAQEEFGIAQAFAIARLHAHIQAQLDAQKQAGLEADLADAMADHSHKALMTWESPNPNPISSLTTKSALKAERKSKKKTKVAANDVVAEQAAPSPISMAVEVPVFKLADVGGKKSVVKKLKRTKKTVIVDNNLFVTSQASPADSICIYNKGWCISPDTCNYDLCFADTSKTEIKDGERYLFAQDGIIKMNRIKHDCDSGLLIGNTIPREPNEIISPDELDSIKIIGWVYSINTTRAWID